MVHEEQLAILRRGVAEWNAWRQREWHVRLHLEKADLRQMDLKDANLHGAALNEADLQGASLVQTKLEMADLTGCWIYGISAWNLSLDDATRQHNLVITRPNESMITVDNLEVAQFVYLLLNNQRIRHV